MARSAKDLRNIINISRLSLRNETSSDEISENDEINENDQSNNSTTLGRYLLSRPSSALSESSFSTLSFRQRPGTAYKKRTADCHFFNRPSTAPANQVVKCITINQNACKPCSKLHDTLPDWKNKNNEDNFDDILKFVDGSIVNSWLEELNSSLEDLVVFFKTNDNFVEFSEFFLNKLSKNQLNKLLDLEFSILVDQFKYAFHAGFEGGHLTESNIFVLAKAVVKEYPKKLKGSKGCEVLLDIILVFCNGKNDNYRSLLKKVVCKVKSKQNIHWLLAFRAFSLINLANGVITFFKKVQSVCDSDIIKNNICTSNYPVKDWMIQAVKKGYKNVCLFFLSRHKEYSYSSMHDDKSRNLLFIAIAERKTEMVEFLLPYLSISCLNEAADNGNSPLHYAVGIGDWELTHLLLRVGANVNISNYQCEGATALHTAVMLGNLEIVELLLRYGADKSLRMGIPPTITSYSLACELNHVKIKELLKEKK